MNSIISTLFPTRCIYCNRYSSNICELCLKTLTPSLPECYLCRRVSSSFTAHKSCIDSANSNNESPLSKVIYLWKYDELASKIMSTAKYQFAYTVYEDLMKYAIYFINNTGISHQLEDKILIPIPQHRYKAKMRGFDHTGIIAKHLSESLRLRFEKDVLIKVQNNKRQAEVTRSQRHINTLNAYSLNEKTSKQIPTSSKVVLIDDVMTTGSTLIEACKTIKQKRPDIDVSGLTLFRGRAYYGDSKYANTHISTVSNPTASVIQSK